MDAVQTEEELLDVYTHFMLYYGRDVVAMQNKRTTERRIKRQNRLEPLLHVDSHTMSAAKEKDTDKGITVKRSHKLVQSTLVHAQPHPYTTATLYRRSMK